MKRTLTLAVVAFVAMLVMGCTKPTDPPDPVKVYLTGAESFTRVDAAGSLAMSDIYQWDNDADGTVDDDTMYIGDDVEVTGFATGCFCITTSTGIKYLNVNFLSDKGYFYSDRWNAYYDDPEYGSEADLRFVDSGAGVTVLWTDWDYDETARFWTNALWSGFVWNNMGNIVEHAQSSSDGHFEDFPYTWIPNP